MRARWWLLRAGYQFRKSARPHSAMKLARQFGIRVKRCRPALVPLLFHDGGSLSLWRTRRRLDGGPRFLRFAGVHGEDVVHAPRAERSGDSADFLVLAGGASDRGRSRARARLGHRVAHIEFRARSICSEASSARCCCRSDWRTAGSRSIHRKTGPITRWQNSSAAHTAGRSRLLAPRATRRLR